MKSAAMTRVTRRIPTLVLALWAAAGCARLSDPTPEIVPEPEVVDVAPTPEPVEEPSIEEQTPVVEPVAARAEQSPASAGKGHD